jgi:protein-tyrosine phosphatase
MTKKYSRHLKFKSVANFRDIGGYRTRKGNTIAWRRVFRSGEFAQINQDEYRRLKEEIKLTTIIDLRSEYEIKRQGIGLPVDTDIKYHNVTFLTDDDNNKVDDQRYKDLTNMGDFYILFTRNKVFGASIVKALEVIAGPENHPLVFNCAVGKDRTGILAAVLLSVLGVADDDIIKDYSLSGPYMEEIRNRVNNDPEAPANVKNLPDFFWKASPESMGLFLNTLRRDYGSIEGYLEFMGSEPSLVERLEKALLSH